MNHLKEEAQSGLINQSRRTTGKVEFVFSPTDGLSSGPRHHASAGQQPKHEWNPDCLPVTPSLIVRTSLGPESGHFSSGSPTGDGNNRTESQQPCRVSVVSAAVPGLHIAGDSSPPGSDLGTAISVSSVVADASAAAASRGGADGDQGHSGLESKGAILPAERMGHEGGSGGFTDGVAVDDAPLCTATGERPSFIEGVSPTVGPTSTHTSTTFAGSDRLAGAARKDVFVDGEEGEDIQRYRYPSDEDDEGGNGAEDADVGGADKASKDMRKSTMSAGAAGLKGKAKKTGDKAAAGSGTAKMSRSSPPRSRKAGDKRAGGEASSSARDSISPVREQRSLSQTKDKDKKQRSSLSATKKRSPSRVTPTRPSSSAGSQRGGKSGPSRNSRSASRSNSPAGAHRSSEGVNITEKALKSINYAAFTSGNLKPKAKRAKMLSEFFAAHHRGAAEIETMWNDGSTSFFHQFVEESFDPHRRELLRLVEYMRVLRNDCKEKLEFATSMCNHTLDGAEGLLEKLRDAGLHLSDKTRVLSFVDLHKSDGKDASGKGPVPQAWGQPSTPLEQHNRGRSGIATGHVMPEVQDTDAAWRNTDTHPKANLVAQEDIDQFAAIKSFFSTSLDKLREAAVELSLPPNVVETGLQNREHLLRLKQEESARMAQRADEALALKTKLGELASATAGLMQRLERQHDKQQQEITGLQRALDENITKQKLADDVLRGCLAQGTEEAGFSFSHVKNVEMQLRARMDALEVDVRAALDELILNSADVCMDNGAYNNTSANVKYNGESCLKGFASRMERSAIEQADVLREAQNIMQRLWQSSSEYRSGREEKRTLLHRGFPAMYEALLQQCDRDTLLRLIHHLSLQSSDMTRCLMSALQEHEKFLMSNDAEAVAVREQEGRRIAVTALLERMYEESFLHDQPQQRMAPDGTICAPHGSAKHVAATASSLSSQSSASPSAQQSPTEKRTKAPLSEIIANMVMRYNEMMTFEESYARALAMQRETLEKELDPHWRPSFFDKDVPVPFMCCGGASADDSGTLRASLSSSVAKTAAKSYASCGLPDIRGRSLITEDGALVVPHEAELLPSSSYHAPDGVALGRVVAFLQKSNPSLLARFERGGAENSVGNTISVVGDGRWSGRAPARASTYNGTSSDAARSAVASLPSSAAASSLSPAPPPALPPRKDLVSHVMSYYSNTVDQLTALPVTENAASRSPVFSSLSGAAAAADCNDSRSSLAAAAAGGGSNGSFSGKVPVPPPRAKRALDNHDLPFLQKQRQALEPLLGAATVSAMNVTGSEGEPFITETSRFLATR